jgi:hypothetical protein
MREASVPMMGLLSVYRVKDVSNAERANSTLLLQQPIVTWPGLYRHVVEVEIRQLSFALQKSQLDGLAIEHNL